MKFDKWTGVAAAVAIFIAGAAGSQLSAKNFDLANNVVETLMGIGGLLVAFGAAWTAKVKGGKQTPQ